MVSGIRSLFFHFCKEVGLEEAYTDYEGRGSGLSTLISLNVCVPTVGQMVC